MRVLAALFCLTLAGCAHQPVAVDDAIRHYVRSNRDGSSPEHIVHFRPSATDVSVYKWVSKCNGAAYVTAQMDPAVWEPRSLIAGRVATDGSQKRIGELVLDRGTRILTASIDLPEGKMTDTSGVPAGLPWFLFDYDLGDLNTWLQETKPQADFRFAWALVWPEGKRIFGETATVQATLRGIEARGAQPARRFDLRFVEGRPGTGTLWIDPTSGALIEAEVSEPNHPGMTDYRLKLERIESGGTAAWQTLLRSHYGSCPAETGP